MIVGMQPWEIEEIYQHDKDEYIAELEGKVAELEEELRQFANHNLLHYWYDKCQSAERELRAYRGMPKPIEPPY